MLFYVTLLTYFHTLRMLGGVGVPVKCAWNWNWREVSLLCLSVGLESASGRSLNFALWHPLINQNEQHTHSPDVTTLWIVSQKVTAE